MSRTRNIFIIDEVLPIDSMIRMDGGNGHGSTNTVIRRFLNTTSTQGAAITLTQSATNGDSFTINETGVYAISYNDFEATTTGTAIGLSLNSSELTTAINIINTTDMLAITTQPEIGSERAAVSWTGILMQGDIIRAHTDGNPDNNSTIRFTITKVANL